MRRLLIFLLAAPLAAQTINPNQIKPSTTNTWVLTTTSGHTVWAPPTGGGTGYSVKHNGTLLTGDFTTFTDFDDTTPGPPPGSQNVTFQANTVTGKLSAYVSNFFRPLLIPPISGQYVILHPTSNTPTSSGSCTLSGSFPVSDNNSALLGLIPQASAFPPSNCQVIWGFAGALAAQAPQVIPANVTAVYASANTSWDQGVGSPTISVNAGAFGPDPTQPSWPLQQSTSTATGITGTGLETATITALLSRSGTSSTTISQYTINSPSLFVFYTGTPPAATNSLLVAPPFTITVDANGNQVFGIDRVYPQRFVPQTIAQMVATFGPAIGDIGQVFAITDGTGATDCTVGGGSTAVVCQSDGSAYVAVGSGGSSGLSGMTAGQVPIAATATTVTSSKVLAGSGAGITTGPTSSTTGHCVQFTGSGGQIADSGASCASGGTTTNPLTVNNGGSGDASGFTFDGSAAKTLSYNSIGAAPTASPTFTGTPDASGATQFKLPVAAGATTLANGEFKYDTTNKNWHSWGNGVDNFLALFPVASPPTNGDCVQFALSGGVWTLSDAGAGCGGAGGPPTGAAGGVLGGTYPNPAFATIAADAVLQNATGGTAAPTAVAMPTCTAGADLYNTSTHSWSCVSTSGGGYTNVTGSAGETTVALINTACGSGTYYATTALSIATGGTINCPVQFSKAGLWTIASGQTVTFSQIATETDGPHQHFAGTGIAVLAAQNAPVEWWGAVGYATQAAAISGTDSTTLIQACITAITGQCLLQAKFYKVTAALTIGGSNKGIGGFNVGSNGYGGTDTKSVIITTSASLNVITAAGSASVFLYGNEFTQFEIRRSVTPTGTATGLSMQYMAGYRVDGVVSMDSIRDFYIASRMPSWTTGYIQNSTAVWGNNTVTSTGSIYGFYFDGVALDFASLRFNYNHVGNNAQGTTSYSYYFTGNSIDIDADGNESGGSNYGLYVNGGTQDFHWLNFVHDGCLTTCIYMTGAGTNGELSGGWMNANTGATYAVQILSATGVTLHNFTISNSGNPSGINIDGSRDIVVSGGTIQLNSSAIGVRINNSTNSTISTNSIDVFNSSTGIAVSGGSLGIALTGNAIRGNASDTGIAFTGSSNNTTAGNSLTFSGATTVGISYDATSASNRYAETNGFFNVTTPISNSGGTTNQLISISPLTTKGDVWGYSTANARVPVGANGTVLTADSTQALGVKWASTGTATLICSGSQALGTTAIGSGAAATTITTTCTGLLTTDNIQLDFNADPTATTGYIPSANGMLTIIKWPTANTINISVVNNTGSSITPGAVTVNYRVVR